MYIDEILEILNGEEEAKVYYGPEQVVIEDVNRHNGTVKVRLLMDEIIEDVDPRDLTRD